ncbi:MAG: hypothetical protein HZA61_02495 [Candidatus Eisenbacteria bacterium]|uniref:Uncharacterized protein n=1 Tax=Eiseniibacteriota bacterium TaxID=2212470 RepID=A0A933SA38_UNCEI|nr:hypothetical protein [Candidatus Eisenbacteria bacterium]
MKRFACTFALLLCATAAAPAVADLWWPANSTIPSRITIVGWSGARPDAAVGQFEVVVRDLANNPVPGSVVVIDFSSLPEVHLASDQMDAAVLTNCAQHSVRRFTDAAGRAVFTVMGHGGNATLAPGPLRAHIYADGVLLGSPLVAILDVDGSGGAGANDVALFLDSFALPQPPGCFDYDGSEFVGANDLAVWLNAAGLAGSAVTAPGICP